MTPPVQRTRRRNRKVRRRKEKREARRRVEKKERSPVAVGSSERGGYGNR
jgi:hypothetical protein